MAPALRKLVLTTHITTSVGWLGAVVVFLALAVVGIASPDTALVRAVYRLMEPAAWYTLVPLAAASLLTGVVQSLGGAWGLLRHYWVLFKLLINIVGLVVLLMYTTTLGALADLAAAPQADVQMLRSPSVVIHAVVALVLLVLATVLAVYKPRGRTPYAPGGRLVPPAPRPGLARSKSGLAAAVTGWPPDIRPFFGRGEVTVRTASLRHYLGRSCLLRPPSVEVTHGHMTSAIAPVWAHADLAGATVRSLRTAQERGGRTCLPLTQPQGGMLRSSANDTPEGYMP